ncbi:MAG: hypothetical protein JHC38_10305 [Thiotrichales bacterium]|jgi:hypothetical protein|nr:hypothetical protein [Thiotrichales bacterium]
MKLTVISALGTLFLFATAQAAELLTIGSTLPSLKLTSQHDKPATIDAQTRRVIFAADKQSSSLVTEWLDNKPANYLTDTHSVYLADIHKMPSLISKFVAIPQLKEKPYDIVLGREEADMAMFPREKGCLTLLTVSAQKIDTIQFICSEDGLKNQIAP